MATKRTVVPPATTKKPATTAATKKEDEKLVHVPKGSAALAASKIAAPDMESDGEAEQKFNAADLQIPRISVLQSGSGQVKKGDPAYKKGAEEGDFWDNVLQDVTAKGEDGLLLIPVSYRRTVIEWIPKNQGGGFIADHGNNQSLFSKCTKNEETGQFILPNGHELVDTMEYYCYVMDSNQSNPRQAVISLAKTQQGPAKKMNTMIASLLLPKKDGSGTFNPPRYANVFQAITVPKQNKKSQTWMLWNFSRLMKENGTEPMLTVDLEDGANIYRSAKNFAEQVAAGNVKVSDPSDATDAGIGTQAIEDDSATL